MTTTAVTDYKFTYEVAERPPGPASRRGPKGTKWGKVTHDLLERYRHHMGEGKPSLRLTPTRPSEVRRIANSARSAVSRSLKRIDPSLRLVTEVREEQGGALWLWLEKRS